MLDTHLRQMEKMLGGFGYPEADVLDVGSFDVNGSFRAMVERRGWTYTGLDIAAGRNVDVVSSNPYHYGFNSGKFDIVISGSTMEHVEAVWLWVDELARLLRPNGMLAIITHHQYKYHPHPVDCWRIMPDGMRFLFERTGVLKDYQIELFSEQDISGLAWKVTA